MSDAIVVQRSWRMLARWAAILALSFGFLFPALAQNAETGDTGKKTKTGNQPGQTGAGQQQKACGPLPCSGLERGGAEHSSSSGRRQEKQ
jgi:hypothetical protein